MESVAEIWEDAKGFEGMFQVSNQGRVKALPHETRHWCGRMIPHSEKILVQTRHTGGYRFVAMRDGKKHYVHRLVMAAFVGEPNGRDVNHIDGDKTNNRLENLEYCDRLHNVRHAIATGLQDNSGESNGMNRYPTQAIIASHRMVQHGSTYAAASRATGVGASTIKLVVTGKRWKHLNLPVLKG